MSEFLQFRIINTEEEARKIWEQFSPHKAIDDEWDFRYTWFRYLEATLHFIVGYDKDMPVGLLALQCNPGKGLDAALLNQKDPFLEFFGGIDSDDNHIYIAPGYEQHSQDFFEQIKEPAILTSLRDEYSLRDKKNEFYIDKYIVPLEGIRTFYEYMDKHFSPTIKKKVKHALKRNKMKGYTVEIQTGSQADLPTLFALSQERFGEKSSFHRLDRQKVFYDFTKLFNVDVCKILLNGEVKAIAFSIIYKNTYVGLSTGYDHSVPNLGKLLFTTKVERAVNFGCTIYDTGQGNNGWKDRLYLPKKPQYKLTLNIA